LQGKLVVSPFGDHLILSNAMYRYPLHNDTECSGSYDVNSPSDKVTIPLACTHGRSGNATISRNNRDKLSGTGVFQLSDGSFGSFEFGIDIYDTGVGTK
jgi:hypothetical protein